MKMDSFSKTVLFSCFIFCSITSSYAQPQNCSTYAFSGRRSYSSCTTLVLNSSIHWNYHPNHSVDIAYRHTGVTRSNWVAWALNPTGNGMRGAQALVAFFNSTTSNIRAYTSPISSTDTVLQEGPLSFQVPTIAAEFVDNGIMIIYATIQLPEGSTRFTQVWQQGDVLRDTPQRHPMDGDHLRSVETIDFAAGSTSGPSAQPPSPPPVGGGNVPPSSGANDCPTFTSSNGNSFRQCNRLPVLDAFLHWNYHEDNHSVNIAYRHTAVGPSNWVAWALNPTGTNMLGAQALVAFVNSSGSIHAYTSPLTSYVTTLQEGPLSFPVQSIAADFVNSNEMIIYATIELPAGTTSFTQVWQHGDVTGNTPQRHPLTADHLSSVGRIDFATGLASGTGGAASGGSRQRRRNTHGVLGVVSWGIMMPLGAMAARYLKVFKSANPAWFYLHVACQASAYIVGVTAWGIGLKLGSESAGVEHTTHRNIGIALFTLATLQAFALLLRPKPDHKYRFQWNIYHHAIGYSVIILSIVNIFEGLEILDPEKKWERAYVGVLIFLGASAAVLEAITWYIVVKRKRKSGSDKHPQHTGNGYHA